MSALRAVMWGMIDLSTMSPNEAGEFRGWINDELHRYGLEIRTRHTSGGSFYMNTHGLVLPRLNNKLLRLGSFKDCCAAALKWIEEFDDAA